MKYSNRFLGFLLLFFIIGISYIFYSYFFKIKLVDLEINSNVDSFSGKLYNIKFEKTFECKEKKCIISKLPTFSYDLSLRKKNYKNIFKKLNLTKKNKINIEFKKDIFAEELSKEKVSREYLLNRLKQQKDKFIKYSKEIVYYNEIINNKDYVYFIKGNNIIFYNLKTNYSFKLEFNLKVNYVKDIKENIFVINTEVGSFSFNIKTKNLEYFSMFSDYVKKGNYYIGVINKDDIDRKKNFGFDNEFNLLVIYDLKKKKAELLESYNSKIKKIYIENQEVFIELGTSTKYRIKNL